MLPNFLIIGAAKAGTTSLCHYLRQHPQVFMPATKELNFFVEESSRGRHRAWYEQQFAGAERAIAVGEASPRYTMHPVYAGVARRIAEILPAVRLIYLLRHPIERIRSHYLDRVIYGAEKAPISEALLKNPIYVSASRYASQIERYLDYFPRDQLLLVAAEHLRDARAQTVRKILEFVKVDPNWEDSVLEREFHRTAERRAATRLGWLILRHPGYRILGPRVPGWLKRVGRALATRRLPIEQGMIPGELQCRIAEGLRDDVVRLRRYMDEPFDGWGIG